MGKSTHQYSMGNVTRDLTKAGGGRIGREAAAAPSLFADVTSECWVVVAVVADTAAAVDTMDTSGIAEAAAAAIAAVDAVVAASEVAAAAAAAAAAMAGVTCRGAAVATVSNMPGEDDADRTGCATNNACEVAAVTASAGLAAEEAVLGAAPAVAGSCATSLSEAAGLPSALVFLLTVEVSL